MEEATKAADVVSAARDQLRDATSLADTPFSALFHAARTSTPDRAGTHGYSGVTVQVRVRDGQIETSDPVKTRQGEHLRGTDAWDGMVSLPVKPFMTVRTARQEICYRLRDVEQRYVRQAEQEGR
jgi:hypothetical protein